MTNAATGNPQVLRSFIKPACDDIAMELYINNNDTPAMKTKTTVVSSQLVWL